MKKIYQKPAINIVKVQVGNIMNPASPFDEHLNPEGKDASNALGRAWDEWDD